MKNTKKVCDISAIDKMVKQLSKMQIKLMDAGITPDEYNDLSESIGNLKEQLINSESYRNQEKKS